MTRSLVGILTLGATATLAGQQPATPVTMEERRAVEMAQTIVAAGGGGRATYAFEARVTTGAPYSAEAITEFTQTLSDGNRISRTSTTRVFRDSEGRTRRETTRQTSRGDSVSITISDPVARVSWVLDPSTRTASRTGTVVARPSVAGGGGGGRGGGGGAVAVAAPAAAPPVLPPGHSEAERREAERTARVEQSANSREASASFKMSTEIAAAGDAQAHTETLGSRVIEGLMAEGTRTTRVIAAGQIGNAQPITIVSEQWYSADLQVFVMTRHSDPRSGETVYRLANIVRGEPDRTLFEVPSDYTIKGPAGVVAPVIRPPQ